MNVGVRLLLSSHMVCSRWWVNICRQGWKKTLCCTAYKRFVCAAFSTQTALSQSLKFLWWDTVQAPGSRCEHTHQNTHAHTYACCSVQTQQSARFWSISVWSISWAQRCSIISDQVLTANQGRRLSLSLHRRRQTKDCCCCLYQHRHPLVENTVLLLQIQAEQGCYSEHIFAEWAISLSIFESKADKLRWSWYYILKPSSVRSTKVKES